MLVYEVLRRDVEEYAAAAEFKPRVSRNRKTRLIQNGYSFIFRPMHPRATAEGYIPESWAVMEGLLGRQLRATESVRRIEKDPLNCDPDNLVLHDSRWESVRVPPEYEEYLEQIRGNDELEKKLLRYMKKLVS